MAGSGEQGDDLLVEMHVAANGAGLLGSREHSITESGELAVHADVGPRAAGVPDVEVAPVADRTPRAGATVRT
jgi:hypothetical protein